MGPQTVDYDLEEQRLEATSDSKNGRAFPIQHLDRKTNFCRTEDKECLRCQSTATATKFSNSNGSSNPGSNSSGAISSTEKRMEGLLIPKPSIRVLQPVYQLVSSATYDIAFANPLSFSLPRRADSATCTTSATARSWGTAGRASKTRGSGTDIPPRTSSATSSKFLANVI